VPTNSSSIQLTENKKIAAVICIEYMYSAYICINCIKSVPSFISIHIICKDPIIHRELSENLSSSDYGNIYIESTNGDIEKSSLINNSFCNLLLQYDYICYLDDSYSNESTKNFQVWLPAIQSIWHNTLASFEYISNVIEIFECNPNLGLLTTPLPFTDKYFNFLHSNGEKALLTVPSLLDSFGIRVKPELFNQFDLNTDAFWCRTAALRVLYKYTDSTINLPQEVLATRYKSSSAYPYIAQHEGYYSGVLMSLDYAGMEVRNKTTSLLAICDKLSKNVIYNDSSLQNVLSSVGKISQGTKVYLYGAGEVGKYYFDMLQNRGVKISGFIVSDGHKYTDKYMGVPVYEVKNVLDKRDEIYIVVSVGSKVRQDVLSILEKEKFMNIISI